MRLLKTLFILVLFCSYAAGYAQDVLKIEVKERVRAAATNQNLKRKDRNGNMCAILQISGADIGNYRFESSVMIDSVEYDLQHNTATMFVVAGQKRTIVNIMHPEYPNERIDVSAEVGETQGLHFYDMKLSILRDKARTLVMPVVGVGGMTDFGVMLSFVKKIGPYFKFTSNFQSVSDDGECTNAGNMVSTEEWPFYTGETTKSRMSFTGGVLIRLWQGNLSSSRTTQGLYTYAGAGYGYADYYWKTTDGTWLRNADSSYKGVEVELGLLYRYKALALSAGFQSNSFKYSEATVGLGIMF